jgi:hypothetical protein
MVSDIFEWMAYKTVELSKTMNILINGLQLDDLEYKWIVQLYFFKLKFSFSTFQLVSSLAKEAVHVSIDLIRVPNIGWCLRFNPLVHAASTS